MVALPANMSMGHTPAVSTEARKMASYSPGSRIIDGCEPPCEC